MPSFDVVSKVDLMELDNAVNVAQKEITTRYDFRGTNSAFELKDETITVRTSDVEHLEAALQILRERLVKRGVSPRCLDPQKLEDATHKTVRQVVKIKQGIESDVAKKIVKRLKDEKFKVQASIQGDELRVTGKNRDDLQSVIAFLRKEDYGLDLQFVNFRD
ncbi:MAG: YajQ family cyclic di-GMP-binding protein [Deltaproteobacteria bacterium]|nr:YajQ family cyclic di-GMP-binding protein [Deltaproteobacteria bacterium]